MQNFAKSHLRPKMEITTFCVGIGNPRLWSEAGCPVLFIEQLFVSCLVSSPDTYSRSIGEGIRTSLSRNSHLPLRKFSFTLFTFQPNFQYFAMQNLSMLDFGMALGSFLSPETFIFFPQTKTILLAGPGCSVDDMAQIMPFSGK
jgi:hypothetical protein